MSGIFRYNSSNSSPVKRTTLSPFCVSPGQLQDVTMEQSYAIGYRSPCLSLQHNGATSPGQGRSIREFEEQMASLRKENFNLKLRIYFLEEKMPGLNQMNTPDGRESLMKQYLDNKVETEVLRKDLEEKQQILREAAEALTHMENIQKETEQKNQQIIDEFNSRIEYLEMENKEILKKHSNSSEKVLNDLLGRTNLEGGDFDAIQKIRELEGCVKLADDKINELIGEIAELKEIVDQKDNIIEESKQQVKELNFQNSELQEQLENIQENSSSAERKIHNLEFEVVQINQKNSELKIFETHVVELRKENKKLKSELELQKSFLEENRTTMKEHQELLDDMRIQKVRDDLHKHKAKLADTLCELDDAEEKLKEKNELHKKAMKTIEKLIEEMNKMSAKYEELKKKPQGIIAKKDLTDSTSLCKSLSDSEVMSEISVLKKKLNKIAEEKNLEIKNLKMDIKKKTINLQNLVNKELWEKNREIERLSKLVSISDSRPSSTNNLTEFDQLEKNFTDNDLTIALDHNKKLQNKVDSLIQHLGETNNFDSSKLKNPFIEKLQKELEEAREDTERANKWRLECSDVCSILTVRLEELAGFLDSLLKHKDILNAIAYEKRLAMRKAVDKSFDLSKSLNEMSLSISGLSLEENSLAQLSSISCILDQNVENKTFNSHEDSMKIPSNVDYKIKSVQTQNQIIEILKSEIKSLKYELEKYKVSSGNSASKKDRRSLPLPLALDHSESEAWSEPDRNVSLARIGLEEPILKIKKQLNIKDEPTTKTSSKSSSTNTSNNESSTRKSKLKSSDKVTNLEEIIVEKDNKILEIQCELVEADNRLKKENLKLMEISRELNDTRKTNEMLQIEIAAFKTQSTHVGIIKANEEILRRDLMEKNELLKKLQEERNQFSVDCRVAEKEIEKLKSEIEELHVKHDKYIENMHNKEKERFNQLHKELQATLKENLKELKIKHKENLEQDWIAKTIFEATKKDLEILEKKLTEALATIEFLQENEVELKNNLIENEKSLRALQKTLDDSTLSASKAILERTKALNDKLKLETKLQEIIKDNETNVKEKEHLEEKIIHLENSNVYLHKKLLNVSGSGKNSDGYTSEEVNVVGHGGRPVGGQRLENSSPDLGIESDTGRTSNVETKSHAMSRNETESNDNKEIQDDDNGNHPILETNIPALPMDHECAQVYQENLELRSKLKRTTRQYEDTLKKLRTANQVKEQVERDIRHQIVKTNNVLKNARTNIATYHDVKKPN